MPRLNEALQLEILKVIREATMVTVPEGVRHAINFDEHADSSNVTVYTYLGNKCLFRAYTCGAALQISASAGEVRPYLSRKRELDRAGIQELIRTALDARLPEAIDHYELNSPLAIFEDRVKARWDRKDSGSIDLEVVGLSPILFTQVTELLRPLLAKSSPVKGVSRFRRKDPV